MLFRTAEDSELVDRAAHGEVDAYNVLVSRWEKKLYNYLLRTTGNREDAQDLSQEAFLKAYRGLVRLGDAEKFPQWLFRIAHNLACSKFRTDGRRPQADSAWADSARTDSAWADSEGWAEANEREITSRGEAQVVLGAGPRLYPLELELIVARALEELPFEQRQALLLKVIHGFKFAEIAEILSCPLSTVKSRVYAGFEQLKHALGEDVATRAAFHNH